MSDLIIRDEELVQLRADLISRDEEISALRAALEAREAQEAAAGPVRILPLLPETRAILPNSVQMRALLDAVNTHWPNDDFKTIELEMFRRTFFALGTIHRSPEIDQSHYVWHWLQIARERGRGDVNLPSFLAAACAWSDIEMVDFRLENEGVLPAFALNEFHGRLPKDQWHATLKGSFMTPTDPRPKRYLSANAPRPIVLVDGKPLPNEMRYVGPRYWSDF